MTPTDDTYNSTPFPSGQNAGGNSAMNGQGDLSGGSTAGGGNPQNGLGLYPYPKPGARPDPNGHGRQKKNRSKNEWLLSYLDVFTLLLAFFLVVSASVSDTNVQFFEQDFDASSETLTEGREPIITPIWDLFQELETTLEEDIATGLLRLDPQYDEIRLIFTDGQFYNTGSATLLDDGRTIVNRIMDTFAVMKHYEFYVDVEGHTDDRPIQTLRFPSNWELSTARASGVIRYFKEQGFPVYRLKASGYADVHPKFPNRDELGNSIPENMDRNRRIVIRIFYELGEIS